jgi:hypothetical protein
MARSKNVVSITDGAPAAPRAAQETVKAISRTEFDKLVKKTSTMQANMDTDRASLGGVISDAVEHKRLHKGAFGIFRRMHKMDAYKRAELLYHLDLYREWGEWDTSDMFEDRDPAAAE